MKNIWNIFRADWRRLTASVVAVVVLLGLCLVPCLYAWFNILSNWDPYGTASTSRISVAVASEDAGCEVLGLEVNIGALVLQGLESNDQMGWVFVDSRAEALDGVESGDYYAALIVPEEFTEDFVSILSGDLRHPQIQYYENEKKNAIAPKITSKAKTAVQEQINTTVIGKAAEALTTAGSVFKAMGLDSEALADGIMDKLTGARQEMAQLQKVLLSLKDVMNGADGLLTAASVTIADARGTVEDADAAAGSTVQLISTGLSAADTAYSDLLTVLNNTDKVLGDIEDALRSMDTSAADEALKADLHRKIQAAIDALKVQLEAAEDEALKAQLETAIADLEALDALVDTLEPSALQGPVLDMLHQVRQELLAAAVQTNKEVNEYLHTTGAQAQTTLRSVQQLLGAVGGSLGEVSGTLDSYADAMTTVQPTLDAGITLANTVETYLADIEDDVRRVTESEAFKRFTELMESSDAESMADYLSSPVQLNTEIIYEIKDYGAAMSPYYVMLALFVGSLLTATSNPETGENPLFGQLAQGSLAPHVEKMRMTATQFAAATGLTVTDVGVINDANPTSSDAILAQSQTLVLMAQQLNNGNGDALRTIARMAQAIARSVTLDELTEEERDVMAHFKNPAMPSVAVTADAAIKIATARQEFASTDTFLEMIGFDQADILRIKAQEQRVRGQKTLLEVENEDNGDGLGGVHPAAGEAE